MQLKFLVDFEEFKSALTIFQGICLAPRNESGLPAAPGRLIKTISVPSGDHLGDESLSNDGASHLIGISSSSKIPIKDLSVLYDTNAIFVPSGDHKCDPLLPLE